MEVLTTETIAASRTYNLVEPFGPKAVDLLGSIIPVFKNIFEQLSAFFETIAGKNA